MDIEMQADAAEPEPELPGMFDYEDEEEEPAAIDRAEHLIRNGFRKVRGAWRR